MPGVEPGRFKRQPLNPNFICSICRCVLLDPVQRPSCQHIFCKECITNWLVHQNNCPIDRQPLTRNYLVEAPRVLRELLGELQVLCEFDSRGCDYYGRLDELESHAKTCMYNPSYPIKAKFETILRAKSVMSGSHSVVSQLLRILEEKEKLVKEQETLIAKILEEGEDINKVMKEFTDEKEKIQRAKEDDMNRFKEVIVRLQRENEELKERLTENRMKLIKDSLPVVKNDPWKPLTIKQQQKEENLLKDLETRLKVEDKTTNNHNQVVAPVSGRDRSSSRERGPSPMMGRRSSVSSEHKDTLRKLKAKFPEKVTKAMQLVDLAAFYQIEPYSLSWASYVGERVKREAIHVHEGYKVLVMCCWSDLYIPVCLCMVVGPSGCVVTRGYSQPEIDRVKKDFAYLIEEGRLIIVLEDEEDSVLREGYPEKSPFDVIFVPRAHYTPEIEEQRKPKGMAYDPYEEVDLTPCEDRAEDQLISIG